VRDANDCAQCAGFVTIRSLEMPQDNAVDQRRDGRVPLALARSGEDEPALGVVVLTYRTP
jgi:hypothetical protein